MGKLKIICLKGGAYMETSQCYGFFFLENLLMMRLCKNSNACLAFNHKWAELIKLRPLQANSFQLIHCRILYVFAFKSETFSTYPL